MKPKILAVDDEAFNLDIMTDYLIGDGYEVIGASDGQMAMEKLAQYQDLDVIVLDRMMPKMNGMQVLEQVKANPLWKDIPVIMQTAAASSEQILQGIQAGVYYYLTKPYEDGMLLSIVRSALRDAWRKKEICAEVKQHRQMLGLMQQAQFKFRTLDEAQNLAFFISYSCPDPERVAYGLNEILVNAIEHGNLGITYEEKTKYVLEGTLTQEITRRLSLPDNLNKFSFLFFTLNKDYVELHIKDMGVGFSWKQYLEINPERAIHPHGRGIATAKMMSFDYLEYMGCGNEVICRVYLNGQT